MIKRLLTIGFVLFFLASSGQSVVPFKTRFHADEKGGIVFLANTVVSCRNACPETAELPPGGIGKNNDFIASYVDIDANPSTFSSSSDSLALPKCSQILFAGLYWGAEGDGAVAQWNSKDSVKLMVNNGNYVDLKADTLINNITGYSSYHCFKDITSLVLTGGNSRYTVANVVSDTGSVNKFAGWTIVIVYKNDLMDKKSLTVFDGLSVISVDQGGALDIKINGFVAPLSGPVNFDIGLMSYDGDRGITSDSLLFQSAGKFVSIGDALNTKDDIFNSTISNNGVLTPYRIPSFNNNLGFDADIFRPDNSSKQYITNGGFKATLKLKTDVPSETYIAQMVTMAIDIYEPDIKLLNTVKDVNGGLLEMGDTLQYTITMKNTGSDIALNTQIIDTIYYNIDYVPNSVKVIYGPNLGNKTDVAGDDQVDFDTLGNRIIFRVGTDANANLGGVVINDQIGSDSTVFVFRAKASESCARILCSNIVPNRAFVFYTGQFNGTDLSAGSNPDALNAFGCPLQGSTITYISAPSCTSVPDTSLIINCVAPSNVAYPKLDYLLYDNTFSPVNEISIPETYYAIAKVVSTCRDTVRVAIAIIPCSDNDGDGLKDDLDIDDDNDGILDVNEGGLDPDVDGVRNNLDLDSDNDGIPDLIENGGADANGDGRVDGFVDVNNDGLSDNLGLSGLLLLDSDNDAIPNIFDLDSDKDGIVDLIEAGGTDANMNAITDNFVDTDLDGFSDVLDPVGPIVPGFPLINTDVDINGDGKADSYSMKNADNTGFPDFLDIDSDDDGTIDNLESQNSSAFIAPILADSDNDGLSDAYDNIAGFSGKGIVALNSDADGLFNHLDLDSDNDGIPDLIENGGGDNNGDGRIDIFTDIDKNGLSDVLGLGLFLLDSDKDGIANEADLDADNDGLTDLVEVAGMESIVDGIVDNFIDVDNDGLADSVDPIGPLTPGIPLIITGLDGNADGIPELYAVKNFDQTGFPDFLDIDADGDGIVDNIESQNTSAYIIPTGNDTDGDGIDNAYDNLIGFGGIGIIPVNSDSYLNTDYIDLDSDFDFYPDNLEAWDTDNNGIANVIPLGTDLDADGLDDGYDTNDAAWNPTNGQNPNSFPNLDNSSTSERDWRESQDNDGDGLTNNLDLDDDNDGILDTNEGFIDTDNDGEINSVDLDSDNDGIPDIIENGGLDANGDGIIDGFLDANNDGLSDNVGASGLLLLDNDGDAIPNILDLDDDNDGIVDLVEAGGTDANKDGQIDNMTDFDHDGFADSVDPMVGLLIPGIPLIVTDAHTNGGGKADSYPVKNTDNITLPDFLDIDADNDGIVDNIEGQSTLAYRAPTTTDSDKDGLNDAYDLIIGFGGAGILPHNTDGTDNPDYTDLNTDNDSDDDDIEGWDTDNDGKANIIIKGIDSDGDGLDNAFDNDNTIWNPTNLQTPYSFPNLDNPSAELDWRDNIQIHVRVFVPQGFSPNSDGINDYLHIKGIEVYKDNSITVFNRWGSIVYDEKGYDNAGVRWNGNSRGDNSGASVPEGVYFYLMTYMDNNQISQKKSGYIYVTLIGK